MSISNHLRKKKLIGALTASFAVVVALTFVLSKAFASTAYYLTDATVELDGINDGSAYISFNTPIADEIFSIEGTFQTSDDDHYFTLTALTPASGITPSSNVVSDGRILWQDASWEHPLVLGERESMWTATYSVDKNTPVGDYTLHLYGVYVASESEDYDTANLGDLTATVTVTRNDTPATKPSQVVTFRDAEGEAFAEITKYYGDDDFVVTKEVTTGDSTISEYHPDDDGSGSVAHTAPDSDMVGVGIPGDVEICAWLEETENYAATKACYTVHVQKRPLDITGATIANKTYDGTTDATVTSVSFEDRNLESTDYTATASFDDADAGENKAVRVSVELTESASEYYVLNASNFNTTKTIDPYLLTATDMTIVGGNTHTYVPGGIEPEVRVTASTHGGTSTLTNDDYDVEYVDNTHVGSATIRVTGKGNFTTGEGPVLLNFNIEPRGFNDSNVTAPSSIVEGHILTADEISVNVDGVNLVRCENAGDQDCDYTVAISGDNDGIVGHSINVAINGCNNYSGVGARDVNVVAKLPQTVTIADVTNTTINKVYGDSDFTYTAETNGDGAISYSSSNEPVATVDANGKVTIVGVGDAEITATAAETDTYASSSAKYTIHVDKKTITFDSATVSNKIYDGTTDAEVIDAVLSDRSLIFGTDYTLEEAHFMSADAGEGVPVYVKVKLSDDAYALYQFGLYYAGGGDYILHQFESNPQTAELTSSADIAAFTLGADNTSAALANTAFEYDSTAKEPTANIKVDLDGNGTKETTLAAGTDYEINYNNNTNAGTATATISGKGNYTGSLPELEFTISPATVTNVTVTVATQTYTGSALEPVLTVTGTVNGSEVTFTTDDYAIAAHEDFIDAGDHTITINPKDGSNYNVPTTDGTFTIDKATSSEPADTPSDLSAEAGGTLADLGDLPEGFAWVDPTTPIAAGMNDYPATYTKNGDAANYTTVDVTIPVLGYTAEYEVIKGDGQKHIIGVDGAAEFEIDADYEDLFEEGGSVYVDNELVEPANYEAWSNSTVISLSGDYLDSLALGEHSLAVLFNDGGIARATFTVEESESEPEPDVADTGVFTKVAGGAVATILAAIVLSTLIGVVYVTTRKNN